MSRNGKTVIGFTGTRQGLSEKQKEQLKEVLVALTSRGTVEAHHGDCVGADAEFHQMCREMGLRIVIHPPIKSRMRAFCSGNETCPPGEYRDRNQDIVDACDILIAGPRLPEKDLPSSGTWMTVRMARSAGRPIVFLE